MYRHQSRSFSSSSPVAIRKVKARPVLTKAQQAAKERKKAQKARKNIYENEKMTLEDAIKVLRVSYPFTFCHAQD